MPLLKREWVTGTIESVASVPCGEHIARAITLKGHEDKLFFGYGGGGHPDQGQPIALGLTRIPEIYDLLFSKEATMQEKLAQQTGRTVVRYTFLETPAANPQP